MVNNDFDAILAERERELIGQRRPVLLRGSFDNAAPQAPEAQPGLLGTVGDVLAAPFRGVEGALQDTYGLVDTIFGDALPDYDARLLGESKTGVGGLVEGLSNFAAGFIPVAGWLGRSAKLGRVVNLTKGAETAARAAGSVRKAAAISAARGAIAGAITDFTVFDGHEERLSNLIEQYPALANPITSLLAADEDDPELVGRLKAVVEGFGLGVFTDSLFLGVKALRAGRKARAAGASADGVEAAMREVVADDEHAKALDQVFESPEQRAAREAADAVDGVTDDPLAQANRSPIEEAVEEDPTLLKDSADAGEVPAAQLDPESPQAREALEAADQAQAASEAAAAGSRDVPSILAEFTDEDTILEIVDELERRELFDLEPGVNPRKLSASEILDQRLAKGDLNLSAYKATAGAKNMLRAVETLYGEVMKRDVDLLGKKTLDELDSETFEALSDIAGARNRQLFMTQLQRDVEGAGALSARVRAYKAVAVSMGEELRSKIDLALSVDPQVNTRVAALEARQAAQEYAEVVAAVKGLVAEQGRALRANALDTVQIPDFRFDPDALDRALQEAGGEDHLRRQLEKMRSAYGEGGTEGLAGLARTAEVSRLRRGINMVNEYWINSILSGGKTLVVNGLGGLMTSVYRPLEAMLGGALSLNGQVVSDAFRELVTLATVIPESFKLAKAATREGENILTRSASVIDLPNSQRAAITSANAGLDPNSIQGAAIDWLGKAVRIPSHILTGTDEFIKQMNYRSTVKSQLTREGLDKGLRGNDLAEYVVDSMTKIVGDGQAYSQARLFREGLKEAGERGITDRVQAADFATKWAQDNFDETASALSERALDTAEEVTFTRPLRSGTISASVQNLVNAHPTLRLVLPFIRTPVNILRFTGQRFDVVGAAQVMVQKFRGGTTPALAESSNRLVADIMSGDARRAADARGRFAAGMMLASFGFTMAQQGNVTGRGPSDPEQRAILQQAGWLPYSIRTKDGYVSYQRLDPFASLIGLFADISDYARFADTSQQSSMETLSYGVAVSIASNITNKSYLTGLRNFVEALSEPDRFAPKLIQRYAASFVPSAAGQAVVPAGDDNMREVRGIVDALAARTPGLSSNLEPVRNVFGEPVKRVTSLGTEGTAGVADMVLPLAYREVNDDTIAQEFAQLGHGFTPPKTEKNGINLLDYRSPSGQSAYDRWSQLHGEVKLRGQTLREALTRTIKSASYQRLSPESTHTVESPRIALLSSVIQSYRRKAYEQLLREYPELRLADRTLARERRLAALGLTSQ